LRIERRDQSAPVSGEVVSVLPRLDYCPCDDSTPMLRPK
jgi:hypothetical protein